MRRRKRRELPSPGVDGATRVALAFHRSQINRITLAAADRDHQHGAVDERKPPPERQP